MKATTSHEEGDRTLKDTMKCTKHQPIKYFIKKMAFFFFFPAGIYLYFSTVFVLCYLTGSVLECRYSFHLFFCL